MLAIFNYVFEELQCDPNHVVTAEDVVDAVAKAFFNEDRKLWVNTFLHTLIVNEHHSASGNSLAENVLNLPSIIEKFNFNKKDIIIEGLEKEIAGDGNATYIYWGQIIRKKREKQYLFWRLKRGKLALLNNYAN